MCNGYGRLNMNHDYRLAHRLSWEIHYGPIPPGSNVLHRCDVKHCVNPQHLYLGTHTDNARDVLARGSFNHRRGETHHRAKLSDAEVAEIRLRATAGETYASLGRAYSMDPGHISRIVRGLTRRHDSSAATSAQA